MEFQFQTATDMCISIAFESLADLDDCVDLMISIFLSPGTPEEWAFLQIDCSYCPLQSLTFPKKDSEPFQKLCFMRSKRKYGSIVEIVRKIDI